MFTPRFHDDPRDPKSPWRGYEVIVKPATATTYKVVCTSCVTGGGEDKEGSDAGFFMTVAISPDAGAVQIEINNDDAYFDPSSTDNTFFSLISNLLYGK
jgi:hypothetical protein